eukprot:PhF_6_TR43115/c0_g1_i1/m.65917
MQPAGSQILPPAAVPRPSLNSSSIRRRSIFSVPSVTLNSPPTKTPKAEFSLNPTFSAFTPKHSNLVPNPSDLSSPLEPVESDDNQLERELSTELISPSSRALVEKEEREVEAVVERSRRLSHALPDPKATFEEEITRLKTVISALEKSNEVQLRLMKRKDDMIASCMRKEQVLVARHRQKVAEMNELLELAKSDAEAVREKLMETKNHSVKQAFVHDISHQQVINTLHQAVENTRSENETLQRDFTAATRQIGRLQFRVQEMEHSLLKQEKEFQTRIATERENAFKRGAGGGAVNKKDIVGKVLKMNDGMRSIRQLHNIFRSQTNLDFEMVQESFSEMVTTAFRQLQAEEAQRLETTWKELGELCISLIGNLRGFLTPEQAQGGLPSITTVEEYAEAGATIQLCDITPVLSRLLAVTTDVLSNVASELRSCKKSIADSGETFVNLAIVLSAMAGVVKPITPATAVMECRNACDLLSQKLMEEPPPPPPPLVVASDEQSGVIVELQNKLYSSEQRCAKLQALNERLENLCKALENKGNLMMRTSAKDRFRALVGRIISTVRIRCLLRVVVGFWAQKIQWGDLANNNNNRSTLSNSSSCKTPGNVKSPLFSPTTPGGKSGTVLDFDNRSVALMPGSSILAMFTPKAKSPLNPPLAPARRTRDVGCQYVPPPPPPKPKGKIAIPFRTAPSIPPKATYQYESTTRTVQCIMQRHERAVHDHFELEEKFEHAWRAQMKDQSDPPHQQATTSIVNVTTVTASPLHHGGGPSSPSKIVNLSFDVLEETANGGGGGGGLKTSPTQLQSHVLITPSRGTSASTKKNAHHASPRIPLTSTSSGDPVLDVFLTPRLDTIFQGMSNHAKTRVVTSGVVSGTYNIQSPPQPNNNTTETTNNNNVPSSATKRATLNMNNAYNWERRVPIPPPPPPPLPPPIPSNTNGTHNKSSRGIDVLSLDPVALRDEANTEHNDDKPGGTSNRSNKGVITSSAKKKVGSCKVVHKSIFRQESATSIIDSFLRRIESEKGTIE